MKFEIAFKRLPFEPEEKQVFYIENEYDRQVNDSIKANYDFLKWNYVDNGLSFVYLPLLLDGEEVEEKVRYYAPYLKTETIVSQSLLSSMMLDYMANPENRSKIIPSLLYNARKEHGVCIFQGITIEGDATEFIIDALGDIQETFTITNEPDDVFCSNVSEPENDNINTVDEAKYSTKRCQIKHYAYEKEEMHSVMACEEEVEESEEDIHQVMRELRDTVRRLKLSGISLAAIHELIDNDEPLSRLVITEDYRIFLPDYNNIEIEMTTLPKALFFLFLRYPEGIVLKHMVDHHTELINIYKELKPNADQAKMQVTITQLCNPTKNRINENITRISSAFRSKFDDHLARNYYPQGKAGEPYSISLNPELIIWEE